MPLVCACGLPALTNLPCLHMLAFAKEPSVKLNTDELFIDVWKTDTSRRQYPKTLSCSLASKSQVSADKDEDQLEFAIARIEPRGRPKAIKRKKSALELGVKRKAKKSKQ